ncbi:uncharacterized protein LOC112575157 [Pomacea canaliculata]|uniref:uncharacterized protein LOC112575157 n=1 Tax=Pomacea canaliculata TaxID=400727 RepID=UPI000D73E86D|nr:uncharacterized protein LOC112575157 [Pomacea canaliculata]XP_025112576.1 uncharacterized protein LOC112575157 [Pomacea canaliculata]
MGNGLFPQLCWSTLKCITWLLFYLSTVLTQDDKITCTILPVTPFQDTVLTCHFPEDLSVTKKDFTVYHYGQDNSPDSVLDCWWIRGSLDCYTRPGFTYDKRISRTLNITVNYKTKPTGKYACQVAGYSSSLFTTCEFVAKLGPNNTCNISKEQGDSQINVTCFFNEDIQKTQRNFTVYKHHSQEKLSVLKCWWENEKVNCQVNEGYLYSKEVSSYLQIGIPPPTNEKTEIYSCWHDGSIADRVNTCSLNDKKTEQTPIFIEIVLGIVLGIVTAGVLVIIAIVLFKRYRVPRRTYEERKGISSDEESHLMKETKKKKETFEDLLLKKTKEMYPNMQEGCYFVPPVYLNKLRYKTQSVAGQLVYIPDPPDPSDESRARAMQHVIHSLRDMADSQHEHMFVLTQFQYEDYLNNPGRDYRKHRLPVPTGLKEKNKYKDIGCFDFLIIHRHHGVLVGVVKDVDEKESGNQDKRQRIKDNASAISPMMGKETNSQIRKGNTDGKESGDSIQTTEVSESSGNQQETLNNDSEDNEQKTGGQRFQDGEGKGEDDNIQDYDTNTKNKDQRSDDTLKTTDNKESRDTRRSTEELVIKEVYEAIQQFKKADIMIHHLLSDQDQSPTVRLILVLPNITSETLRNSLDCHPELTQNFLECIQQNSINDLIELCLCADHLPSLDTTRNVESVKIPFQAYWDHFRDSSVDTPAMTDDLFANMIARFCGPSTISYFKTPCKPEVITHQLPKTLDQAVSLTGELFERFTLYPGMTDFLDLSRAFLVGPQGTGKTRMLSLVGRKWLSEGHDVYVLYTSPEGEVASMVLQTLLQGTSSTQPQASPAPSVITLLCNIDDDNKIDNAITMLKDRLKDQPLYALIDELAPEKEKGQKVRAFLTKINESLKDTHLWAASYRANISPPGWNGKFFQKPISCPPSIVRETGQGQSSLGLTEYSTSKCFSPTDGLPVKRIYHRELNHSKKEPHNCEVCGQEVAKFLTQDLHVGDRVSDIFPTTSNSTRGQRTWETPVTLEYRDVMILFEKDITEDVPMIKILKDKGIPVQIINSTDERTTIRHGSNTVLVAKAGFLNGLRRKVVVYVEGDIKRSEFSAQWSRLRGITSCTAQLVCVRNFS